jgi:hypothetical protein
LAAAEDDDGQKAGNGNSSVISDEQAEAIRTLAMEVKADVNKLLEFFKAESIPEIRATDYSKAIQMLEAKKRRHA